MLGGNIPTAQVQYRVYCRRRIETAHLTTHNTCIRTIVVLIYLYIHCFTYQTLKHQIYDFTFIVSTLIQFMYSSMNMVYSIRIIDLSEMYPGSTSVLQVVEPIKPVWQIHASNTCAICSSYFRHIFSSKCSNIEICPVDKSKIFDKNDCTNYLEMQKIERILLITEQKCNSHEKKRKAYTMLSLRLSCLNYM